jgi:glycosyltransferase involved in cell wall biosynthesis
MERKMALKVCQLCAVDFTVKHFLTPLIDGMIKQGWDVTTICSDGRYVNDLRLDGYRIITTKISRSYNFLSHLNSIYCLYKIFRQEKFDVVHVHTPVAALVGRLAGWVAGVRVIIYTAHGFYFHDGMNRFKWLLLLLLEKFASYFHHLLFIQSSEDVEIAKKYRLAKNSSILEISNGVNPNLFYPLTKNEISFTKASFGIPEQAKVIGIVGRLVKEKGYLEFFSAVKSFYLDFPDVHFIIVGSFLENESGQSINLNLYNFQKKLGSRLHVLGYRSDIRNIIGILDIFCLPSHREGLPRSIIEAMMLGVGVVATDIRGCRELIQHNITGLLIPAKNASALSDALQLLLNNDRLLRNFGVNGSLRARLLYDEDIVVKKQIDKIQTFLKNTDLL